MVTLKRDITSEWLKNVVQIINFTKNYDIFTYNTCEFCPHCCNVSTWIQDKVVRDQDRDVILGLRDRDETETLKNVSRDV